MLARPAFPVLVKAWVCARGGGSKSEAKAGTRPQRSEEASENPRLLGARVPGEPARSSRARFRACAESAPDGSGLRFRPRALPPSQSQRRAAARGRRGDARRGRSCAAGTALAPRTPLLPVCPAPALRQSRPCPLSWLSRAGGAMAAFSKYLTARNSSLAGAALLLLYLLRKRRRALGLRG